MYIPIENLKTMKATELDPKCKNKRAILASKDHGVKISAGYLSLVLVTFRPSRLQSGKDIAKSSQTLVH